jgi:hypothetical protein
MHPSKLRARLEMVVASCAGILGVLTIFWHDWDPDHHNGSVEWIIVVVLLAISVGIGLLARRDWKLAAVTAG